MWGFLKKVCCTYNRNVLYAHQQTISSENVANITSQLETVVLQATEVVDQSASNLDVVTTVITQIANISSPSAPIDNNVGGISLSTAFVTKQFLPQTISNVVSILSSIQTWSPTVLNTTGSV